jgi:hypothetical protein
MKHLPLNHNFSSPDEDQAQNLRLVGYMNRAKMVTILGGLMMPKRLMMISSALAASAFFLKPYHPDISDIFFGLAKVVDVIALLQQ